MIDIIVPQYSIQKDPESYRRCVEKYLMCTRSDYFVCITEIDKSKSVQSKDTDGVCKEHPSVFLALKENRGKNVVLVSERHIFDSLAAVKFRYIHVISFHQDCMSWKFNYNYNGYNPLTVLRDFDIVITVLSQKENEKSYLSLLRSIADNGETRDDRTGTGTLSKFGCHLEFDLRYGFPLLTSKRMYFKGIALELLWFLSGSTDSKVLEEKGCKIWKMNSTRDFLDARGLKDYREGDIGPMYGHQWRHAGAEYKGCDADYTSQGVDQIQRVIELIKTDPYSRRIIISSYNSVVLDEMALEPCHCLFQFYVSGDCLSGQLYQRSGDMFLGVPFNIASYALLLHIIAHFTGKKPGMLHITLGDAHIYKNHLEQVKKQLSNKIYLPPVLEIVGEPTIDDISLDNLKIHNYQSAGTIKAEMAI